VASAQRNERRPFRECSRVADVPARGEPRRRRAVDGRHVPPWAHRARDRSHDRNHLTTQPLDTVPRVRGRLAPSEMYPAGIAGVRTRMLTMATGMRVRVVECGPTDGAPVVLIHGWGACVYTYRFLLQALGSARRRVIAFDLR